MYLAQSEELEVRARTPRGGVLTRTLALPPDVAAWLGYLERNQCGFLRPDEALGADVVGARAHGDDVIVTYTVVNSSVEPVTLSEIRAVDGIRATARTPLRFVERGASGNDFRAQTVEVVLRATDCDAIARLADLGGSPDYLPFLLLATVSNRYVAAELPLSVVSLDDDIDQEPETDAVQLLLDSCS
jgi:hypothetical protein